MDYEPSNEAGVIIVFTLMMKNLGFSGIVKAQGGFPDCIARRRGKNVLIEFDVLPLAVFSSAYFVKILNKRCARG